MKKMKYLIKEEKGITLVALVVTIVVLIILAGISINLAVEDNGIISKAKQAKEMQEMSDVHDKLELIRGKVAVDNETIVTWDKYKYELIKENIITGDDDVEDIENGKKQIVTDTGYVAVIEIAPDGTVGKIEIIGKKDSLKVNIINVAVTSETSSIKVDVTAKRIENATFRYYYKIEGGEYQTSPVHEGTDLSYTITNLAQNTTYTIKVQATNKNGTIEKEAVARTGEVAPAQGAITFDNLTWTSGKASVTVNKTISNNLQIQYKVNTGSYAIITSGATVNNMSLGDVLTVRLYDGTNYGSSASLTIADTIVPNSATISLSSTSAATGESLTAEVTQTDNQSGVNITLCKWIFNTTSSSIGTTESSYTGGTFSATPQTITLPSSTAGTYYLHVLTIDNAGNKIETISGAITIKIPQTVANQRGGSVLSTTDNTKIKDDNGNEVTIPAGFRIASDSATAVTRGVVIEDVSAGNAGSQFVWVPVGKIYTDTNKTEADAKTITLSRYTFASDGTPTDQGSAIINSEYMESETSYGNTVAKSISNFKTIASNNRGFYIGRYEARKDTNIKLTEKGTDTVYNNITQLNAATACRNMYNSTKFTSDLINSYAWDTAIVFEQTFGGNSTYSQRTSVNITLATTGTNNQTTQDTICSIYDMGSNCTEWTTETGIHEPEFPCVGSGGNYYDNCPTSLREKAAADSCYENWGFRPILYV